MNPPYSPITLIEIAYNEVGINYYVPVHIHQLHQWYCVLYGRVDTTINGVTFSLGSEGSVLIPPGMERSPRGRDKACGYLYVLFENQRLQLSKLAGRVLVTPSDLRADLAVLVREIRQPGANTHELVEALVVRLLIGLGRGLEIEESLGRSSTLNALHHQEVVERIEAFMERNLKRELSREDLAQVVHLSPTHMARVFHQAKGCTLTTRLVQLRVARAKQLLLESTLPISQISLDVGYTSFSHFARVFREAVGVTPGDYRRSQGSVWRIMDV